MSARPADQPIAEVDGLARLDLRRRARTGIGEVVFGHGKPPDTTLRLLAELRAADPDFPALATRCPPEVLRRAVEHFPDDQVAVDDVGATVVVGKLPATTGTVSVLTAGTSDLPVARECVVSLGVFGVGCRTLVDVGVAGIGRLLAHIDEVAASDCVIAIAGMEGALPSVVAGLIPAPLVAVPTSVGYGVSADGTVAAAAMLASCSPGIAVVNIDNGFGAAAYAAKVIHRMYGRRG